MAVKNLLKGWSAARAPDGPKAAPAADDAARRLALFEDIERASTGWFWATDREGHLSYISPGAAQRFGILMDPLVIGASIGILFGILAAYDIKRVRDLNQREGNYARLVPPSTERARGGGEGGKGGWEKCHNHTLNHLEVNCKYVFGLGVSG